jgi:hypothetical protein
MAGIMRLRVTETDGGSYDLNIGPKVIVEVERHFKKSMAQLFNADNASYEALCYVAWRGSQIAGKIVKPFDEWLGEIDGIEAVDEKAVPLGTA